MKKSQRKNSPTPETRFMFLEDNYWHCWGIKDDGSFCDQNHADCLHHILGRGECEGCEKSVFNMAPVSNHFCHLPYHGRLTTDEGKRKLLQRNIDFLSERSYTLNEIDEEFLRKYDKIYKQLKIKI
jgi:hypothetical protein